VIIPILTILVSPFGYRAVVCLRRNIRVFRLLVEAPRVPLLGILAGELLAEQLDAPVMRTHEVSDVVIVFTPGS